MKSSLKIMRLVPVASMLFFAIFLIACGSGENGGYTGTTTTHKDSLSTS